MSATVADDESSSSGAPTGAAARLRERFGHLVKEFGKFGTVGGVAFAVDLLIFNLLISGDGTPVLLAKTISTVIAATLAFVGNRFWTWRHRERSGLRREYLLYFFFNAVGLGIGLACLGISHYVLGNFWPQVFQTTLADNISGQLIGTAVGTLFRFWSYRRFVFIDAAAAPRTPSAPATVTKGD
ncbi:GtrA family protein [Asanoa iriomotensis]|uniref:GtrA family protein n=1 Tax=Asanoa iriomotensis TaxID=234613 RepID=UPI0031D14CAA